MLRHGEAPARSPRRAAARRARSLLSHVTFLITVRQPVACLEGSIVSQVPTRLEESTAHSSTDVQRLRQLPFTGHKQHTLFEAEY